MATHGRGLICLCLTPERCDELGLRQMTDRTRRRTARRSPSRSRRARASRPGSPRTIARTRSRSRSTRPSTAARPRPARPRLPAPGARRRVLQRAGQTEAAVDLARLAGLAPAGVVCEIMNDDGTMARVPDLIGYCERHGLKMVTVADLIEYRRAHEKLVERVVSVRLPDGVRRVPGGRLPRGADRQAARRSRQGRGRRREDVLVRVHSECLTGDVFHSLRCDCGEQLESALARIEAEGSRRSALPRAGGPRHRPAQQAARLRAPGVGSRHGRGEPRARLPRRRARVRDRLPDPRRPGADDDPHADEQPEEDHAASRASGSRSSSRSRSRSRRTPRTATTSRRSATSSATRSACRSTTSDVRFDPESS